MSEAVEQSDLREGYEEIQFGPKTYIVPTDWSTEQFGDVFNRRRESISANKDEKIRYVGLKHLNSGQVDLAGYDEDGRKRSSSRAFHEGDVLFGKLRPNLNKAAIAPFSGICSSDIIPIYAEDEVLQRYLPHLMHSKFVRDRAVSTMEGTNLPRTSWDDIAKTLIPLPRKPEQLRIADILSTVDEEIRQTDEIIDKTEELKQGLMQDLFKNGVNNAESAEVRLGAKVRKIPQHWDITRLGEISDIKRGASPRPIGDRKYFGGEIGWIRISDITQTDTKYVTEPSDFLSELGVSESVLIEEGTLVLSISATIGKPAILQIEGCIHDGIVALRNLRENVDIEYLYYALQDLRPRIQAQNQRAAGHQTNVNSKVVKQSEVPLPPLREQKKIADILGTVDRKLEGEKERSKSLHSLKRGLIQDLLTGKVRVVSDT
jgi:type I restriction enzyme S subunit